MNLLNFTIIKLLIGLVIGIVLAHYFPIAAINSKYLVIFGISLFLVTYIFSYFFLRKTIWFGVCTYLFSIYIGIFNYHIHDVRTDSNHYLNKASQWNSETNQNFVVKLNERLKSSLYNYKYTAEILCIDSLNVQGKILLNVPKDSSNSSFNIDDILYFNSKLDHLPKSLNPHQFDYGAYLNQHHIYHQISISNNSIVVIKSQPQSLSGYADALRTHINLKLKASNIKGDELSIVNALLLGQRQDIDRKLYATYTNAGVIHILAVSGLHVGIILLILNQILKPICILRHGKMIKAILIVLLLWGFAIIAGLSPSVTRAVTMFSLLTIALHSKRPTNTYNTLAISAFILLLVNPRNLFEVGFQMSYFAVWSILFFQPILIRFWNPRIKLTKYIWEVFTVTVAAQIGVLPLSIYYFHQFPGLFFIANLIIIPFLGILLIFGLTVIILGSLNTLPIWMADILNVLIRTLNRFVAFISRQEDFLITNISVDLIEVFILYLMIISTGLFFLNRSFKNLFCFLAILVLMQSVAFSLKYKHTDQRFIIFHKNRQSIIGVQSNSTLFVFKDHDSTNSATYQCITDYQIGNRIKDIETKQLQSVFVYNNKIILIVDSLSIYNVKNYQPDVVLLRDSPHLNLNRLLDSIQPKKVIADGSNYRSYVKRWALTCRKRKLPFHYTGEKGAFILN